MTKGINLVEFQEKLNEQFLDIYKDSLNRTNLKNSKNADLLGIFVKTKQLNWFFPLPDLQHISAIPQFEEIFFTKPFIRGFTQYHGDVFLIIDWQNFLSTEKMTINKDVVLMHFFPYYEQNISFLIDNLNLEYSAEYTRILTFKNNKEDENNEGNLKTDNINLNEQFDFEWVLNKEISDLFSFVKKDNLSNLEVRVLELIVSGKYKEFFNDKFYFENFRSIIDDNLEISLNNKFLFLLLFVIEHIYLDGYGKRPIFTFNIKNFNKLINIIRPY